MTYSEMVVQIPRLSVVERLQLLELLSRSLREELVPPAEHTSEEREQIVNRLFGAIKLASPLPTDEELNEAYTDYLSEKYS